MSYDDGKYMGFKCSSLWNALHVCNLRCLCLSNEYEKIVGGFGDLEDLLQGYSSVSNLIIDEQEVKKWQVFGSLRWGVICLIQTYSHLNGPTNSVERAAIGRSCLLYTSDAADE